MSGSMRPKQLRRAMALNRMQNKMKCFSCSPAMVPDGWGVAPPTECNHRCPASLNSPCSDPGPGPESSQWSSLSTTNPNLLDKMPDEKFQHLSVLVREFIDQRVDGSLPVVQVLRFWGRGVGVGGRKSFGPEISILKDSNDFS